MKSKITLTNYLLLSTLFFQSLLFSQNNDSTLVENFLNKNPTLHELQIEKFFLHTNKSIYLAGEYVWFKAYVVNDSDDKPSIHTTNLHINIYDMQKKLIASELFLVQEGTTNGKIKLKDDLKGGTYYIELTTQWNQNFGNNSYLSTIEVLALEQSETLAPVNTVQTTMALHSENQNPIVELHFFPESHVLLENVENNLSFSLALNGQPTPLNVDIVDRSTGIIVAQVASNEFGMGEFKLYCRPGRSYYGAVNYLDSTYTFPIAKADLNGFTIQETHESIENDEVSFVVKTNETTIKNEMGKYIFAVVHRNGRHNAVIPIKLKKEYINYSFSIASENLFNGVNFVTLFDVSNTAISEYAFYHTKDQQSILEVSQIAQNQDSITLNLSNVNSNASINTSISILPIETKVYHKNNSITAALWLSPYLETKHLNLIDLLNSEQKEEHIRLLLNTNKKKNTLPFTRKPNYYKNAIIKEEHGISIKGNVSANIKDLTGYKVMLSSKDNELLLIEEIGSSNSFEFKNLYFQKDASDYKLALLDPNGTILKSGFRIKEDFISYSPKEHLDYKINTFRNPNTTDASRIQDLNSDMKLLSGMNVLEEVELTNFQKREDEIEALGLDPNILDNGFSDVHIIDEDRFAFDVYQYLQRVPGIRIVGDRFTGYKIYSVRGNRWGTMALQINGIFYWDTELLIARRVTDFSAISINHSGAGGGIFGQGGIISFYLRKDFYGSESNGVNTDLLVGDIDLGFPTTSEQFENELWNFPNDAFKKSYGVVDWIPNFDIHPNTNNLININTNGYDKLMMVIEGIDHDGNPVSQIATFGVSSN